MERSERWLGSDRLWISGCYLMPGVPEVIVLLLGSHIYRAKFSTEVLVWITH